MFSVEQKHAAAVALLEKDFGRRLEEALEKERQKAESANDEVVSKRQLEELKVFPKHMSYYENITIFSNFP